MSKPTGTSRVRSPSHSDVCIERRVYAAQCAPLIESLAGPFEPAKCQDSYRQNLRTLIDAKIRGEELKPGTERLMPCPVPDILEVLKASLARSKKPAVIAEPSAAPKRSRKALEGLMICVVETGEIAAGRGSGATGEAINTRARERLSLSMRT